MDDEKRKSLEEHPFIQLMEARTPFTLVDLLNKEIYVEPPDGDYIPAKYWGVVIGSEEAEEKLGKMERENIEAGKKEIKERARVVEKNKDGKNKLRFPSAVLDTIILVQDAAMLVWASSDAPRADWQGEAAFDWLQSQRSKVKLSVVNTKNTKGSRKKQWAEALAEKLAAEYEFFTNACWKSIREDGMSIPGFSGDIWRNVDKEGHECVNYSNRDLSDKDENIKKDAFRTGYFVKAKKKMEESKKSCAAPVVQRR